MLPASMPIIARYDRPHDRAAFVAMLIAALSSAFAVCPHEAHRKQDWVLRLSFATCPHALHVREVLRGSTYCTTTPCNLAL